jgi:isopenicillin-N N-acyltransferase like protein
MVYKMNNYTVTLNAVLLTFLLFFALPVSAESLEPGRLEFQEGQKILFLKGSPYEIGYQQGSLLKDDIQKNINRFITPLKFSQTPLPPVVTHFIDALPQILPHIPPSLLEEMQGIADASQLPFQDILLLNLFPEMFHCTGITVTGDATTNGELYHVRVLDYAAANGLQDTAVLTVVEPNEGQAFLNVTYAGFIGCITGMNASKISIGEIGGKGYGYWDGIPMAFLLRTILQETTSLEEIKLILENSARTCEYYYVFSDGKTNESFAAYTTSHSLTYIAPGDDYEQPAPQPNAYECTTMIFIPPVLHQQPKDILMILRDNHYDLLKDRLMQSYGSITPEYLKNSIKQPIAHQKNLHNAIFAPGTLDLWLSHAGTNNEPACNEPYHHFNLNTMLGK